MLEKQEQTAKKLGFNDIQIIDLKEAVSQPWQNLNNATIEGLQLSFKSLGLKMHFAKKGLHWYLNSCISEDGIFGLNNLSNPNNRAWQVTVDSDTLQYER